MSEFGRYSAERLAAIFAAVVDGLSCKWLLRRFSILDSTWNVYVKKIYMNLPVYIHKFAVSLPNFIITNVVRMVSSWLTD